MRLFRIISVILVTGALSCAQQDKQDITLPQWAKVVWKGNASADPVALKRWEDSEQCANIHKPAPELMVVSGPFYCGGVLTDGCSLLSKNQIIVMKSMEDSYVTNHESLHILYDTDDEKFVQAMVLKCGFLRIMPGDQ